MTSVSVVFFGTSKTSLPFTWLPGLMVSRKVALPSLAYISATPSLEYSAPWASNAFCDEPPGRGIAAGSVAGPDPPIPRCGPDRS